MADGSSEMKFKLRLYVAGASPKSMRAMQNLERLCAEYLAGADVEIIDLLLDPSRGRSDQIVAIPTLVRHEPAPMCKIVGDLSDSDKVLAGLGAVARAKPGNNR